jgi:NTP pyrophosphatase (non-canonical NTP hydrolase)
MDFDKYQSETKATAVYPGQGTIIGILYCGLGLGEAGEIQGKLKKILRDDDSVVTDERREALAGEMGDALWYLARLSDELGISLGDVASQNLSKLNSRKERGTLQGSGDNR